MSINDKLLNLNIITMKPKINDLEDQLSKSILEEQLLKSQNMMLLKELQRLRKRKEVNNDYSRNAEFQSIIKERKEKMLSKHNKNMSLFDHKIKNCEETIEKLKNLVQSSNPLAIMYNSQLEKKKENRPINEQQHVKNDLNIKAPNNIYSTIKCEDCCMIMPPCQYFMHLQNNQCPLKNP